MSVQDVQPVVGRLLSEELGHRLYGALRERILRDRKASRNCEKEERTSSPEAGSESDSHSTTSTLDEVTKKIKEKINRLAYMKKVKRGMLLHQEYIREKEMAEQTENKENPGPNHVSAGSVRSVKRRKRAKSRALTARKGARRVGQSIRRRPTYSPGHSIANRLRRRLLPNKGYSLRRQKLCLIPPPLPPLPPTV
ncbi:hypothetical protein GE061_011102 [Apolygus lucorum]|uniref:Uncharacterized protein n=1 Tax=Apolygus lucorum TaxID=248454 RepID=A0A6A4JJL4_APOLU|nr:hypothetical protein GE061_011102 [Apolygus lucorum]